MINSDKPSDQTAVKKIGNIRWTIVLLMFAIITFDYIDRGVVTVAMPVLTKEFNLSPYLVAIIGDGFTYGYLIMNPVVGYILDKSGTKKAITTFGTAWGVVQTITAAAFSAFYLVGVRILLGITEAVGFPAVTKITSKWVAKNEKAKSATIQDSGVNVGNVLGSLLMLLLVGLVASSLAWRLGFLISGILTIALMMILIVVLVDSPEKHPKITKAELDHILQNQNVEVEQSKTSVSDWFKNRSYWGSMMGLGAQAGVFFGLFTWLPMYLSYARHFSLTLTITYTALIWGFGFIGEIIGGFVIDSINKKHGPNVGMKIGFTVSSLGVSFGLFATIFATSPIAAVETLMVTFLFLRWSGIQWAVSSFLVPSKYAGQFGGHIGFWETLWGIIVPLIFAATVATTKAYTEGMYLLVLVGLIYFIGTVIVTTYKPMEKHIEKVSTS
ncbi:MAG: MFS transporter [Thermoplasmata archaeon]